MLQRTYNQVVSYILAATPEEFEQVLAVVPSSWREGLVTEMEDLGDANRYDAGMQRAYYFERQGSNVVTWTWNYVLRPHEGGELIVLVVSSPGPLDEILANECYARATRRTVEHPRLVPKPAETT